MSRCVEIGTRRELFVDHFLIEEMTSCALDLKRPERREIAFTCDAPWEDHIPGLLSVLNDGDVVRLYYRASFPPHETGEDFQAIALAESTDGGMTFERPNLGLVEFEGSKENNLLMIGGPPRIPPTFRDTNPACKPGERYKGVSQKWGELYALGSPDGLHWTPMLDGPLEMEGKFDTINTSFWDSLSGCYRSFTRYFKNYDSSLTGEDLLGPVEPVAIRSIQSSTSQDFVNWTAPVPNEYDDDYDDMQLYTNAILPCPGAEHIYVGFPNRYVQERVFSAIGIGAEEADRKFRFLLEALSYGAPPHGGIAMGLDRMMMILLGQDSIRDVIAFPKTQNGACLLTDSPATVDEDQLEDLAIEVVKEDDE